MDERANRLKVQFNGTAGYGTGRPVMWEEGGRKPTSYPIWQDWVETQGIDSFTCF